jgi:hypothetical protein
MLFHSHGLHGDSLCLEVNLALNTQNLNLSTFCADYSVFWITLVGFSELISWLLSKINTIAKCFLKEAMGGNSKMAARGRKQKATLL